MRWINVMFFMLMVSLLAGSLAFCGGPSVQRLSDDAKIDWTNLVYIATGEGAVPTPQEEPNRARALLKAKDYAKMEAISNLLMAVEGTTISYDSIGRDYMADTTIRQRIEGKVRSVEVTKTTERVVEGDKIITVEVRAKMFGNEGVAGILLSQNSESVSKSTPKVSLKPDYSDSKNRGIIIPASSGPYTSVIIDTTGYKIDRCISPKIRKTDGTEVWGTVKVDPDVAIEKGIAAYATNMDEAKLVSRCGSNPLIIKAIGRAGDRFSSDPVISNNDADLILDENAKSGFLDKLNVIIIKDGRL